MNYAYATGPRSNVTRIPVATVDVDADPHLSDDEDAGTPDVVLKVRARLWTPRKNADPPPKREKPKEEHREGVYKSEKEFQRALKRGSRLRNSAKVRVTDESHIGHLVHDFEGLMEKATNAAERFSDLESRAKSVERMWKEAELNERIVTAKEERLARKYNMEKAPPTQFDHFENVFPPHMTGGYTWGNKFKYDKEHDLMTLVPKKTVKRIDKYSPSYDTLVDLSQRRSVIPAQFEDKREILKMMEDVRNEVERESAMKKVYDPKRELPIDDMLATTVLKTQLKFQKEDDELKKFQVAQENKRATAKYNEQQERLPTLAAGTSGRSLEPSPRMGASPVRSTMSSPAGLDNKLMNLQASTSTMVQLQQQQQQQQRRRGTGGTGAGGEKISAAELYKRRVSTIGSALVPAVAGGKDAEKKAGKDAQKQKQKKKKKKKTKVGDGDGDGSEDDTDDDTDDDDDGDDDESGDDDSSTAPVHKRRDTTMRNLARMEVEEVVDNQLMTFEQFKQKTKVDGDAVISESMGEFGNMGVQTWKGLGKQKHATTGMATIKKLDKLKQDLKVRGTSSASSFESDKRVPMSMLTDYDRLRKTMMMDEQQASMHDLEWGDASDSDEDQDDKSMTTTAATGTATATALTPPRTPERVDADQDIVSLPPAAGAMPRPKDKNRLHALLLAEGVDPLKRASPMRKSSPLARHAQPDQGPQPGSGAAAAAATGGDEESALQRALKKRHQEKQRRQKQQKSRPRSATGGGMGAVAEEEDEEANAMAAAIGAIGMDGGDGERDDNGEEEVPASAAVMMRARTRSSTHVGSPAVEEAVARRGSIKARRISDNVVSHVTKEQVTRQNSDKALVRHATVGSVRLRGSISGALRTPAAGGATGTRSRRRNQHVQGRLEDQADVVGYLMRRRASSKRFADKIKIDTVDAGQIVDLVSDSDEEEERDNALARATQGFISIKKEHRTPWLKRTATGGGVA